MAGKIQIGSFNLEWGAKKSAADTYDLKGTMAAMNAFGFHDNFSNEIVTEKRAHGLATVFTCINVRARTIASLPINVYREEGDQKNITTDHPAYYPLAHEPNNYMSSANMFLSSMIHSDSWGNSIIGINRDFKERPTSFDLICPGEWDCTKSGGEAWYKINGEMYPSRDVLHFRWFSYDGLIGISPIRLNQIQFGKAFREERYSSMTLGQKPPGFLTYEGAQTPTQRAENQKSWSDDTQSGRTPLLSGKWGYTPLILSADQAAYIESANMSDQKICGIFQMPPVFVQNYERATWANAEQSDLVYAKHTVAPICRIIEQECNMKLFTEKEKKNTYVKFNMGGLLRGDLQARAAYYTAMRNIGGLNGNEMRSMEEMNSYPGGDIMTVQGALIPIDQLREFYKNKVAPTDPGFKKAKKDKKKKVNGFNHAEHIN